MKLHVWLTVASVVLGVLQVGAQYVCATAGELGVAGRSPLVQFMVWDGGWKPVEAYVEGVDALFVPAPLARGNEAAISLVAQRGVLPPGVLKNETLICFKPGSGIPKLPRDTPRGLLVVYKAGGAEGHVLIVDVADVDRPAQPLAAAALPKNFTKVQVVERQWVGSPAGRAVELAQVGALPSPISYAASFSLRSFFGAQLSPGELRCSYFDVPSETSYVAVYFRPGTDPGTYYYEVKRNGTLASSGVISYTGGPFGTALWASETGGRATYQLCIQNKDNVTRSVSATVYLYVRNQLNIIRDDAYYTNVIDVDMSTSQRRNYRMSNTYLYFPGYVDIDAASVIQIYVSALLNPEAVRKDSQGRYYIDVYWGQLYMGRLYGISTASGVKFDGVLTVPAFLHWIITNTRGYGGTISIGPFNYPAYPVKGSARVDVFVERPVELANASSAVLIHYATVRLRADASYHDVMPWSSGFKGVSFKTRVEFVFSGSAGHKLVVSINPYKWNNVENDIRYRRITINITGIDYYGNPVKFSAGGQFDLNAQSTTGQLARLIEWASIILQGLDLGKAVVDYLAKAPSSFPTVSFITIALDAYVNAIQEKGTVQISPDGTIMKIGVYTGYLFNIPLYLLFFLRFPVPDLLPPSVISWFSAYYLAHGRRIFPPALYLAAFASSLLDSLYFGPRVGSLASPVVLLAALALAVLYAATFARGFGQRVASVVLLVLAVAVGHVLVVAAAVAWRALAPPLGFLPLPEPLDLPLYLLAFAVFYLVHYKGLGYLHRWCESRRVRGA